MKKLLPFLLLLIIALLALQIAADRYTPYTDNARVKTVVVAITPQVSGRVIDVFAKNGEPLLQGSPILQIDPSIYQTELAFAQAELEAVSQDVGVNTASIQVAQAQLLNAEVNLNNLTTKADRTIKLRRQGLVSQASVDDISTLLAQAQQRVKEARASLSVSRQKLGASGTENPAIKRALARVKQAQLKLQWTTIKAPENGVVIDLNVSRGSFAKKDSPMLTFMSTDRVWIDAYFTENNLVNVTSGMAVELILDALPGRVLRGEVTSVNPGVSTQILNLTNSYDSLPSVPRMRGWMRDPQRFPVRIKLVEQDNAKSDTRVKLRHNGQADVVVYTNKEPTLLNALAGLWLKLLSYLSYVY